jgi:hypothetical protein
LPVGHDPGVLLRLLHLIFGQMLGLVNRAAQSFGHRQVPGSEQPRRQHVTDERRPIGEDGVSCAVRAAPWPERRARDRRAATHPARNRMGRALRQLGVELVGELRRLNRRMADTARLPGRMPRPSATATTPVLGIASLPASASRRPPVGSNEPVGRSPHGLCHGRRLRPVRRPPGFGLCRRPVRGAARAGLSGRG